MRELLDDGSKYERAGMPDRALDRYRAALEQTDDPALISESLRRQAHVYRSRCDWDSAVDAAVRSAQVAEGAGLIDLLAEAWNAEAAVHQSRGDFDAAIPLYRRMLDTVQVGRIRGVALQNLAAIHATRGMLDEAERDFEAAVAAFQDAGDRSGMGYVLTNLGALALDRGDPSQAEETLHEAIRLAREIQDLDLLALARFNHAETLLAQGELQKAETEVSASLGHFGAAENHWRRLECLRLLGDITRRKGQPDAARRFFEAAIVIAEEIGNLLVRDQLTARISALEGENPSSS